MTKKIKTGILVIILFASCQTKNTIEPQKTIDAFEHQYGIDKREVVFNINTEKNGKKLILKGETSDPELKTKLLQYFKGTNVIDKITLLPDTSVGEKYFGIVNLSVANLHIEPDLASEMATQALMGTPVQIMKESDGWHLVQTPDNYISWIESDAVVPIDSAEWEGWRNANRVIYLADNGLIFDTPAMKTPVSDVVMGNILEVVDTKSKLLHLKMPDGRQGYAPSSQWLNFNRFRSEIIPDTANIRQLATHFTGRPYLWGGTSVHAMDCSGFSKTVYFMNGFILARDASLQAKYGQTIDIQKDFSQLQTGDLIFFGRPKTNEVPERVTHVALSLSKTEYIHASKRVRRNSFNPKSSIYSEYRKNSVVGAKRIVGTEKDKGIVLLKNHKWY